LGHVAAGLRDDDLGNAGADPGDLVEALQNAAMCSIGYRLVVGVVPGGDCRDEPVDDDSGPVDLAVEGVDLTQQRGGGGGVVIVEATGQRLDQRSAFDAQLAQGQVGQLLRVTLTGDQGVDHGPSGQSQEVGGHRRQFDQGVFEELVQPKLVAGTVHDEIV